MIKVLVVDDDAGLRRTVSSAIRTVGKFDVYEAFDGQNAMEQIKEADFDVVILDVDMPRLNGLQTLKLIKEHDPRIICLILTAHANIEDAVNAVKEGAYNYISKPVHNEELLEMIESALEAQSLISFAANSAPIEAGRKFIGGNHQMQKVFHLIHRLSKVDTPVLIRGASGTGKELVARAIHANSTRKGEKFVAINCSAIPENLFESELFGHEKGSFTGADARKIGKFQFAEGGTLFLDELGDMPVLMQVKLLRVLQEKKFTPVGANREIKSNVRIIAATNRPLEKMIEDGSFREDLFYRLNVIPIFLPALNERKDDIERLTGTFIEKYNKEHTRKITGCTPEALTALKKYDWPGNIRELENIIEHAFVMEANNRISISSLPEKFLESIGIVPKPNLFNDAAEEKKEETLTNSEGAIILPDENLDFSKHKEMFEKEFIMKALKMFNGRINQTALHANIPKKTLLRKIEKYEINPKDYYL
ncbi:MAG: sigma-54-dependent transcriptional regulator [Bdellovibrionales bacterium]